MAGIGHNSGRVDEPGKSFRAFAWGRARRQLMPKLPIEIVRRRVARAKELGLPYKTYVGLRAASGDDLIGFMFSSNALGLLRRSKTLSADKVLKIDALRDAVTIGLAQAPVSPADMTPPLQKAYPAPRPLAPWSSLRNDLGEIFADTKRPASRFVLICDTALEAEWADAARMAGTLPADQYFAAP